MYTKQVVCWWTKFLFSQYYQYVRQCFPRFAFCPNFSTYYVMHIIKTNILFDGITTFFEYRVISNEKLKTN